MDQDTARHLFYRLGTLLLLDAPDALEFGIDYNSWTIGPRFKGVKMIPPGVHFVYYCVADKFSQSGLRNGFMKYFQEREIAVYRWNPEAEDFEDIELTDAPQAARYRAGKPNKKKREKGSLKYL
ncbi:AAR2 protein-domain-containing protein [Thamnocephalis sphaerospora]|uniref:AAR2 protein-domain-containing protein n=1 Tax=Thamnocephalis sphaerospora TaxID=78915 RepID=A0A4P9XHE0_9FUNG|nr:AAR2 protein-domain-containing protein [Thamnocephalis sphaerospora]|eukprot:RKP05083.1 AAR2 protein-domain-containing protein [Thamnocephalis sphaerospora]